MIFPSAIVDSVLATHTAFGMTASFHPMKPNAIIKSVHSNEKTIHALNRPRFKFIAIVEHHAYSVIQCEE